MGKLYPVILSGGAGTRLWPVSRAMYPKQLLPLTSDRSMLQETALRVADNALFGPPLIVANNEHRFVIAEQMREIGVEPLAIILEPEGRNTAPAIALAAQRLLAEDPDAVMLVVPSDHVIRNVEAFKNAVLLAAAGAANGHLVTFGIEPTQPETGYGYIRKGNDLGEPQGVFAVAAFVEKPDRATAETYIADGGYYWNSGMFLFAARSFLGELERFEPEIVSAVTAAMGASVSDLDFERPEAQAFRQSPSASIDYAVMEKTDKAAVVPAYLDWSDLGSWAALWEAGARDENGNVVVGDSVLRQVKNSLIRSDGPLVAVSDVDDVVVIATKDAVLVTSRGNSQNVKDIVDQLKAAGRSEPELHPKVYRPWGSYEGTDEGERFQTKRLIVNPGAKLSLQAHNHRAEHWVVVRGTARVTCGEEVFTLNENESTFIPVGTRHRLENPGKIPLHIIEVQSGSYLGEDDIIRFEDTYGRGNDDDSC